MNSELLILVAPGVLFAGALLQLAIARLLSARAKGVLAFLTSLPVFLSAAATLPLVWNGRSVDSHPFPWDGPLAFVLHVDALSVFFALMGTAIGGLVLLYSISYMAHDKSATRFYTAMLVFIGGFVGLVYSANLLVLYLFWELIGLCSFTLVGFWYLNRDAVRGARKVLLMTHIAGYGLLAAVLTLYARTGSALWTDPRVAQSFTTGIFVLMLISLVAKSVQFPLHTWIPEAMAAPTPVSALLHAACYVKAGVYLAARIHSMGTVPASWGASLIWIGSITMAVGVMYAMVQTDLKRMLAFSTVSQIGYMMLGLGIGTPLAIVAGLLHCLNHGFFKGGLFLTAGSVQHATGTRDMNLLGGLAQKMPKTTLCWLVGAGAMAGVPLMSGFASKWMIYSAALQAGWVVPAMVAWLASLGTVFLCAKATSAVFLGSPSEAAQKAHESPASMVWGMGILAVGSIVLGVSPQLAVNFLLNPIVVAMRLGSGVQVTWFGLAADAGSFSTIGGLVLAIVSLLAGALIYLVAYSSQNRPAAIAAAGGEAALLHNGGSVFTGGEPLAQGSKLSARDFSAIFEQNWRGFFRWTQVDRVYLGFWRLLQALARGLATVVSRLERHAAAWMIALAALVFALAYWVFPGADFKVAAVLLGTLSTQPTLIVAGATIAAAGLLLAAFSLPGSRKSAPLILLTGACAVAAFLVKTPVARVELLELAAFLSVALVWITARSTAAKWTYFLAVLLSALAAFVAEIAHLAGAPELARACLLTGVVLKLAALPLTFWLLSLADELPPLTLGLIIAVVDMTAFAEFLHGAEQVPNVLTPLPACLWIAGLTSLIAALLMLAQRSLKRLLVLSTIEDAGFLLLGAASLSQIGLEGAILAAFAHAVAKTLLFAALAAPEADGALAGEPASLANRYPVSAFAFFFGMLAMLGVPPLAGFAGRWRLYGAALQHGPWLLAIFVAASILSLIAYTLALTHTWWGPPAAPNEPDAASNIKEPLLLKAVLVLLAALLLAAGLWPNLLALLVWGRP